MPSDEVELDFTDDPAPPVGEIPLVVSTGPWQVTLQPGWVNLGTLSNSVTFTSNSSTGTYYVYSNATHP